MRRHCTPCVLSLLALWSLLALAQTNTAGELPSVTDDGLELVTGSELQLTYRRRGVNFGEYSNVIIDPVQFAFSDQWRKDFPKVIDSRRQRIGEDLAQTLRATLSQNLHTAGGYPTVDKPRPDALRITMAIAELYVSVPDQSFSADGAMYGQVRTQGLLVVEMRDSVSGLLVARLADRTMSEREMAGEQLRDTRVRADTEAVVLRWVGGILEELTSARVASQ